MKTMMTSMAVAFAVGSLAAPAQARELTYNSFLPAGEPVNSEGLVPFWERIEQDTGGAYSGRMFYAGQMFGPAEVLSGIKDGAIDAGHVQATAVLGDMPYAAVMSEMQIFSPDPVVATAAMAETYLADCPQCTEELAENGVMSLAGIVTQPLYMVCAPEVETTEDLKGLRLMTVLRSQQSAARHFGMTPVSLSFNEMMPSLQRGAIDCIMVMDSWFPAFQLQDMVSSVIATHSFGGAPIPNFLTMSREVWDEMDAETQAVFVDNAIELSAGLAVYHRDAAVQARQYAVEHGVSEVDPGPEFEALFDAFVAEEPEDIQRSFEEFGLTDIGPMIETYRENLAKWAEMIPEDVDAETLAAMIKTEIYDQTGF
ncbi:TRAP transporter substrate-binding protein DctP [Salipiger abyssi]|uniref:TRAP-type C4-dicarboxylate transport system, periplasmic component n=1 Tax=Salipiger abyssi TaxID=1250539 RepID=A0A1P8UN40_9RHOB|nr:TRAP transporter substrate-binding protein DctP [Salipiger abyssi]APZ50792.1 TRAP-type C4-dicarboxylate transport system, periplasmic component [Salipiger abyssi]